MIGSMGSLSEYYFKCLLGASVIALVIILLRKFVCKKVSKRFAYAMWLLIPIYMLLVSFIRLPMPQFFSEMIQEDSGEYVVNNVIASEVIHDTAIQEMLNTYISATDIYEPGQAISISDAEHKKNVSTSTAYLPLIQWHIEDVLKNIYSLLVILFFAIILSVNYKFRKQCKRKREYLYPSEHLGLPVYQLPDISSPFIMGRCIYLPDTMEDVEEIRYAILHEECHFRHGDPLWILIRYLVLGIFFYNPIIWLAFKYTGHDCELACDEEVMERIQETERIKYGGCLLHAIDMRQRAGKYVILTTNMKSSKKLLKERIENIAYKSKQSISAMLLVLVLLIAVMGCALIGETPVQAEENNTVQKTQNTTESGIIQTQPVQNNQTNSNTVSYGDTVQLCLEIWIRPVGETEESYTILENGRELELVVNDTATISEGYGNSIEEKTVQNLVRNLQGKQKGDVVTEIEIQYDMEFHYIFTVLGINDTHHPSYQIPADWNYQLGVAYTKNFYTEGNNNEESDAGKLYGFLEKFADWSGHYLIGSRMFYTNAEASSTLEQQGQFAYAAGNATVCARFCTWCEGAPGDGIGEFIELRQLYYGPGEEVLTFNELCIVNGYAENEKKWQENNRVKRLNLYYEDVYMGTITLEDTIKPQYIDLTPLNLTVGNAREATFRFEIAEVYKGTKYEDTCITGIEIGFTGKETAE